jgi:hypothetical protein
MKDQNSLKIKDDKYLEMEGVFISQLIVSPG